MHAEEAPAVHIVGIGPGSAPDYLTEAARRAIATADLVLFPGTQLGASIRALVKGELRWGRWFAEAELREWVRSSVDQGRVVAWICSGDPSLYSGQPGHFGSLSSNATWLTTERIPFVIHPGVSSLQALLAKLGLEAASVEAGTPMAVYAPGRDSPTEARARIETLCSLNIPLGFFLADESLPQILEAGARHLGPAARIVIGHRIGWPDEWTLDTTIGELQQATPPMMIPRHSLILLGPWNG